MFEIIKPYQGSFCLSVLPFFLCVLLAGCLVVFLAACDAPIEEQEEVDCYPSMGMPRPACVSFAFYHLRPAWRPPGQHISYIRPDDESFAAELYLYDLATNTEHLVIRGLDNKGSQAWSPDGEWIVFGAGAQIYKVRADGSDLTQLTFSRANFDPAWSPDGEWIAYTDATPSVSEQGTYIMRPDGSEKQWLPHVRGGGPTWHPSGEKILTIGGILPSFEYRLFQYHLSDPAKRDTLDPGGSGGVVHTATYIAGGEYVVYDMQHSPGERARLDVSKLRVATNHTEKLTGEPPIVFGAYPAASPDGATIAYVNSYWREGVIWLMNADGSNKRRMGPVAPPTFPRQR